MIRSFMNMVISVGFVVVFVGVFCVLRKFVNFNKGFSSILYCLVNFFRVFMILFNVF